MHELCLLDQDQLSKAPCTTSDSILNDLRAMIEPLSTLTSTCASVLAQERDPFPALKEIQNVPEWNIFLDTIKTPPSGPDYLFRAHKHVGTSQPIFVSELNIPFDLEFRRAFSIDKFAVLLNKHLTKSKTERTTREKIKTPFVSLSSSLHWTIHTAGQKWKDRDAEEAVGLAIFDVKKMRQTSDTTIFRVSDVIESLTSQGRGDLISGEAKVWAGNCDEYVSMGGIHDSGLVRWVLWEELYSSPAKILSDCFLKAYTLGKYRQWMQEQQVELENICQRIVGFAKVIAGPRDDLLSTLIELILEPGIQFWGFETESSEDVRDRALALVNELTLDKLSRLSI